MSKVYNGSVLSGNPIEEEPDDVDRTLNPMGRWMRHNAMHAGTTPMILNALGRCVRCEVLKRRDETRAGKERLR